MGAILGMGRWSRLMGWATIAGIELGLIGPFGSYPANLFTRIGYWTGLSWLGALLLWPGLRMAIAYGQAREMPIRVCAALAVLAGCIPLSTIAAIGCSMFWPVHASGVRLLEWYGFTIIVAGPLLALFAWMEQAFDASTVGAAIDTTSLLAGADPAVGLRETIPSHQLALALCLQMEDHHVRIHLPTGSALHLASLREAMRQAGPGRGRQVHRSWWVAQDAVRGWEEQGRAVFLILRSGLRVPVARNRVAELRADGWLQPRT